MRIRYTRRALVHLDEVWHYTAAVYDAEAADRMLARIESAVQGLTAFPERGRTGRVAGTRELVIPGTPFLVPYRLKAGELHVLAVLHSARRWPERF